MGGRLLGAAISYDNTHKVCDMPCCSLLSEGGAGEELQVYRMPVCLIRWLRIGVGEEGIGRGIFRLLSIMLTFTRPTFQTDT